jgi:GNAT superfamily N-acetyltransferase
MTMQNPETPLPKTLTQSQPAAISIRLAEPADIEAIEWLDAFGTSPHRDISRQMDRYFGSVDPSIHERNVIFLAEAASEAPDDRPFPIVGKAELLLAPIATESDVGYIKRVVVHPAWRRHGVARLVMEHIIRVAPDYGARYLDLHAWEGNRPALHLYEALGFQLQHREAYLRLSLNPADAASPAPEPE